jgi:sterol desaturase/sphingolipid hydroxylase (fatty acid hydroxylase superfamily)
MTALSTSICMAVEGNIVSCGISAVADPPGTAGFIVFVLVVLVIFFVVFAFIIYSFLHKYLHATK